MDGQMVDEVGLAFSPMAAPHCGQPSGMGEVH